MKIAVYCHSIAPSIDGVCRRFTGILNEMVRQGHEVILFTLEDDPEDLPELEAIYTLPHFLMPAYPDKKVAKIDVPTLRIIFSGLRQHRPDVIHCTADGIAQAFAMAGIFLGIPCVASFHTDILDLFRTHNANWFQKFCIMFKERVDSFVLESCATTSQSFSKKLAAQGLSCEHIIITGVDSLMFSPRKRRPEVREELMFGNPTGFLCVYCGRISREKRLDVVVAAVKALPNAYLAIVGDGPMAAHYADMHSAEDRLYCRPRFLDHHELAEIYASSDVHVSASEFETLGNTVLEAFSSQIPVVVPRTQGFCDTVTHEVDGFLFEPGDASSAEGYLARLQRDPQLCEEMGKNGQQNVASRTMQAVNDDLIRWYERGAAKRQNRGVLRSVCMLLLILFGVPFTMACIGGYEVAIWVLGIAPKKMKKKGTS